MQGYRTLPGCKRSPGGIMHRRFLPVAALVAALAAACDSPSDRHQTTRSTDVVLADKAVLIGFDSKPGPAQLALIESFGGHVTRQFKYVRAVSAVIPADRESALAAAAGVRF